MREIDIPVLIVGAGPAGLAAATLLARYDIPALAVSRHPGTANSPRAHITNQRTMEVLRDLGLEAQVKALAMPKEQMRHNVWATSFAGQELARLDSWGAGPERAPDYEAASPCEMCNIPQHLLEPVLLAGAREQGAQVLFNTELIRIAQHGEQVVAQMRDRDSGEDFIVRAQYAIGADGGNSLVAANMGIALEGEMALGPALSCWLEADLTAYCESRPGALYWMSQPDPVLGLQSATFVCVRPWTEWVMVFTYDPASPEACLEEPALLARARAIVGVPELPIHIKAVSKWTIKRAVASSMQAGRVFLAGDAAHRHPPTNGLGTNTSVQDSYNLAWKLAMVLRGKAGPGLLDSYNEERLPVARAVVERAMQSVYDMQPLGEALGLAPWQTPEQMTAALEPLLTTTPDSEARRGALAQAVQLQQYQFNCHGVELGQRYVSAAVRSDADASAAPPPSGRDAQLYYHASSDPGAALPHAWLSRAGQRCSTLDLAGQGRFALLTGAAGQQWRHAAEAVREVLGVDIAVYAIATADNSGTADCECFDIDGNWAAQRGVADDGCVLLRPDRYVAWRSQALPADASTALLAVLNAILWPEPQDC